MPLQQAELAIARTGLAEQAAAEFVCSFGGRAVTILGERAETAAARGHRVAARSWREMADAAVRLLQREGCAATG